MFAWMQRLIDRLPWRRHKRRPESPQEAPQQPDAPEQPQDWCIWEPFSDGVRITVNVPHWQFYLAYPSPSVHHEHSLYGPEPGNRQTRVIPGTGDYWRKRSLAKDPRGGGAVVVFVNTSSPRPGSGWTATHLLIPDPRQCFEGVMP
jgi:hypothetical protein